MNISFLPISEWQHRREKTSFWHRLCRWVSKNRHHRHVGDNSNQWGHKFSSSLHVVCLSVTSAKRKRFFIYLFQSGNLSWTLSLSGLKLTIFLTFSNLNICFLLVFQMGTVLPRQFSFPYTFVFKREEIIDNKKDKIKYFVL